MYTFIPRLYVEIPVYNLSLEEASKALELSPPDLLWAIEEHGRCDSHLGTIIPATEATEATSSWDRRLK